MQALFRAIHFLARENEWLGETNDVISRVKADQSARLFRASPTPFLVLAPDSPRFTITEVNDAYLTATMRTREGLIGRALFDAFPDNPSDLDADGVSNLRASLERVLATREPDAMPTLKYDIARPDGGFEERWWNPVNSAILDEEGEVEALLHHATDVTEQHRTDAALRQSEIRARGVLDGMTEGFMLLDRDFRILEVNAEGARLEGRSRDDIVGQSQWEVWPAAEDSALGHHLKHAMSARTPFNLENRYTWSDGRDGWFDVQADPTGDGLAVFYRDITQRKRAEQRRLALVELSDRISDVDDPVSLAFAASEILGRTLGVSRVGYATIDSDAETLHVARDWNAPGVQSLAGVLQLRDYGSFIDSLKRGEFISITDVREDERTALAAEALESRSARSFVNVPMIERGRLGAVLYVNHALVRAWSEEDLALVREVAERIRTAMERLRAEDALHISEESLRLAVEAAEVGTWDLDLIINKLTWSDRTKAAFGLSPDASCSMDDFYAGLHPDDLKVTSAAFATAVDPSQRASYDVEYRTLGKEDGVLRWVAAKGIGLFDEEGRCIRAVGTAIDISNRKRAELALRESEAAALVDARRVQLALAAGAIIGTWLWDIPTDCFTADEAFARAFGLDPVLCREGVPLADIFATVHPDDQAGLADAIKAATIKGGSYARQYRVRRADGQYYWIEANGRVDRGPDGTALSFPGVLIDVDGRRAVEAERDRAIAASRALNETLEQRVAERTAELEAAQEQLRQSQKMEAMGSLTGGVAHDFNNLLTPIVGALDLLQRKGLGGEREQRLIAGAIQSADRAKTLVQRLLAFARRQPLQATSVDLTPLVRGMANLISSTTGPQIKVVVDAAEDLPPAKADPNQLEMAILNLAVNARDAMPEGGILRISVDAETVGRQHRTQLAPGRYILLSVADTGSGMDEATLNRAVEPFFSTKGVGKGTGLGLSMVHGLASQLGGALTIRSTPGVGTNVEFWLPRSAEPLAIPELSADFAPVAKGSGTVLLVDDEDIVRLSTADMLIELGYKVVEAASAEEALKLVDRGLRPDLLVTDHLMPGMSGTELARTLQNLRPSAKVLIVSGYAEAEGIAPDLPRLTKPFRNADLAASLAALN